jgi:hypothetical protein
MQNPYISSASLLQGLLSELRKRGLDTVECRVKAVEIRKGRSTFATFTKEQVLSLQAGGVERDYYTLEFIRLSNYSIDPAHSNTFDISIKDMRDVFFYERKAFDSYRNEKIKIEVDRYKRLILAEIQKYLDALRRDLEDKREDALGGSYFDPYFVDPLFISPQQN